MTASKPAIRNVPPPPGHRHGPAYGRFIPREQLRGFAAWSLDCFSGQAAPAEPEAPDEPALQDAQAQVAAARQTGYQDGYRDGLVALEGFKQTFAAQTTAQVGQLIAAVDAEFHELESVLAKAVAATAVQLARQVLRAELQARPELVAQVAAQAVHAVLGSARRIVVQLHPLDLALVAEGAAEAIQARGARLIGEPTIARGGCRIESDLGVVDARIDARWAEAAAAMGQDLPWEGG